MDSGIGTLFLLLAIGIGILALFLAIGALFTKMVEKGRDMLDLKQGSSFLIGLVNLIFFGAIFLASYALGNQAGVPVLLVPGALAFILVVIGALLGLTSMAQLLGGRLWPEQSALQRSIRGGAVLVLTSALPFVGWFLALPYLAITGLGAFVRALFQRRGSGSLEPMPEEKEA